MNHETDNRPADLRDREVPVAVARDWAPPGQALELARVRTQQRARSALFLGGIDGWLGGGR